MYQYIFYTIKYISIQFYTIKAQILQASFDISIHSYNHHPKQNIKHFQKPQVLLGVPCPCQSPTPKGKLWSDFYHYRLAFPVPGLNIYETILNVPFYMCFLQSV